MSKRKGTRYERELLKMFWEKNFATIRSAGSGSMPLPSPDLLVGGSGRVLAIECKALKEGNKYFKEHEIRELKEFSDKFGAEAWVAVRFDNKGWFFVSVEDLGISKKGTYFISLDVAERKGLRFDELIR